MSASIMVLCPYRIDLGLISKAASLSGGTPLHVLIQHKDVQTAANYGAKIIHAIDFVASDEHAFSLYLKDLITKYGCNIILAPATVQMRNVMPMLAYHLKAGLTADCTSLSVSDDKLMQTRPAFGNSLMATICTTSEIQLATVRPGTFPAVSQQVVKPEIMNEPSPVDTGKTIQTGFRPFADKLPLGQAEIIVAGGAGIGSKEGFCKLGTFAQKIGASVGASRNAVDAGYASFNQQIGMTGITVCPKIYIAIGISGAVQHLAGMSGAEKIIAINSDPKAPIFGYADYGIVGNWETVIDKLMEEYL